MNKLNGVVQSVVFKNTFDGRNGQMYSYTVTINVNGQIYVGEYITKKNDINQIEFKAGGQIDFEYDTSNQQYPKIKLINNFKKSSKSDDLTFLVRDSIKHGVDLVISGKIKIEDLKQTALRLCQINNEIKQSLQGSYSSTSTQNTQQTEVVRVPVNTSQHQVVQAPVMPPQQNTQQIPPHNDDDLPF